MKDENGMRIGHIIAITPGGFSTLKTLEIEESDTKDHFFITIPNQQSCHPISRLIEEAKTQKLDSLNSLEVAFMESVDDFGLLGGVMPSIDYYNMLT